MARVVKRGFLAIAVLIAAAGTAPTAARAVYATKGWCDGVPRVALRTRPGLCVGLVAQRLGFPRGLAAIGSDVYLADLGSRTPGRGRILRLPDWGRGKAHVVLTGLNQPNTIVATPEGSLIVGEVGRIVIFDPRATDPRASVRAVVTGLPVDGRHNLTAFARASDGALLVNVGARSNNCEDAKGRAPNPAAPCPEWTLRPPRGAILRIAADAALPVHAPNAPVFARGIRNAMGLAFLTDGTLVAATNGRDEIDDVDPRLSDVLLPHDELLVVRDGARFGWPYCFDMSRPSPEYRRYDCRRLSAPSVLLAPHAAPLSMLRYTGALPQLMNKLVLGYHGYRAQGHRIVMLPLAANGLPTGPEANVVWGWTTRPGVHPLGNPSAMLELPDGSILIAEDQNGTLLRLSRG